MKHLVEFPLEDGTTIMVEVEESEEEGLKRVSRGSDIIERAHQTLEQSLERVRPAAQFVLEKLRSMHDSPDEIEVQFGINLNAECGAVLASASVVANYSVKLKWVKDKPSQQTEKK
jgi:hypothetical protein